MIPVNGHSKLIIIIASSIVLCMPSQTSVKPSGARSEGVLQSMAKATGEMVKRKDPKGGHQKKGEALDAQCSKVCYPC